MPSKVTPGTLRVGLGWSSKIKEADVGGRNRRNDPQGRAQGRVRGRVQQRTRGGTKRGGGDSGRRRNTLDLGDLESYANRLADRSRGTSGFAGGASGLSGAASAFAGGSFASRLLGGGGASMSDEDFRSEVAEHFALLEERLQRLEEQLSGPGEQSGAEGEVPEPGPGSNL